MTRHGLTTPRIRTVSFRVTIPHAPFPGTVDDKTALGRSLIPESGSEDQPPGLSGSTWTLLAVRPDAIRNSRKTKFP